MIGDLEKAIQRSEPEQAQAGSGTSLPFQLPTEVPAPSCGALARVPLSIRRELTPLDPRAHWHFRAPNIHHLADLVQHFWPQIAAFHALNGSDQDCDHPHMLIRICLELPVEIVQLHPELAVLRELHHQSPPLLLRHSPPLRRPIRPATIPLVFAPRVAHAQQNAVVAEGMKGSEGIGVAHHQPVVQPSFGHVRISLNMGREEMR